MIISKILEYCILLYQTRHFGSLLEISPTNQVFLKTLNSEFQEVKVWFTDQASKPLELEDKINITLIIK